MPDMSSVPKGPPAGGHEHSWQPQTTMGRANESASPCSRWDDHLWEDVIAVQACGCGAMRYVNIGFKNMRRRGDDLRRREGRAPLGTPLRRSGTYRTPKVLRVVEPKPESVSKVETDE